MHKTLVTPQTVADFAEHGVVLLRDAIAPEWIESLTVGVDKNIASPSLRGRVWDRDSAGRVCFYDSQVWREIAEYRAFVERSPIAEIAAQVLATSRVNFFFDAVFARSPGTQFRTPFHQDEPYWSVKGFDTCSIWMPLVAVEKASALEFVRGSHRWNQRFRQTNFGALTGDARDQHINTDSTAEPFPDIENARDEYDIISWDMAPGDCAIFNAPHHPRRLRQPRHRPRPQSFQHPMARRRRPHPLPQRRNGPRPLAGNDRSGPKTRRPSKRRTLS